MIVRVRVKVEHSTVGRAPILVGTQEVVVKVLVMIPADCLPGGLFVSATDAEGVYVIDARGLVAWPETVVGPQEVVMRCGGKEKGLSADSEVVLSQGQT